jgi:hypothetical protein
MEKLSHLPQNKLDRWTKTALKELSPEQQRYVSSMQWHGYTISKARIINGRASDLDLTLNRYTTLFRDAETDHPIQVGWSEELREQVVSKTGKVIKGRVQFRWVKS